MPIPNKNLSHYSSIKYKQYRASADYPGLCFIPVKDGDKPYGILMYGSNFAECLNTYICVVVGVKPKFQVC